MKNYRSLLSSIPRSFRRTALIIIPGYYMCLLGDYIDKIRDHILNILIRK